MALDACYLFLETLLDPWGRLGSRDKTAILSEYSEGDWLWWALFSPWSLSPWCACPLCPRAGPRRDVVSERLPLAQSQAQVQHGLWAQYGVPPKVRPSGGCREAR